MGEKMNNNRIAKGNHAFFVVAVGMAMGSHNFAEAASQSFDKPALYSVCIGNYSGYISIDSTDIKRNSSHGSFLKAMRERKIFGQVAIEMTQRITGNLNDEAEVIYGNFKFSFKITQYERDSKHGFEKVKDPSSLPENEKLGRFVELKITVL